MTAPRHWHAGWRLPHVETSSRDERGPYRVRLCTQQAARAYLARRLRQVAATTQNPDTKAASHTAREHIWYGHADLVMVAGTVYELYPCHECARWKPEAPSGLRDTLAPATA